MSDLTDKQLAERGHNAIRALEEFLDPAFERVTEEYAKRLAAVCAAEPWATNKIAALANAGRIVTEVRNQITGIVAEGEKAAADLKRAERVEKLSPARKRLLNIGQF